MASIIGQHLDLTFGSTFKPAFDLASEPAAESANEIMIVVVEKAG